MRKAALFALIVLVSCSLLPIADGESDNIVNVTTFSDGNATHAVVLAGGEKVDSSTTILVPKGKVVSAKVRLTSEGLGGYSRTDTTDQDFDAGAHYGTVASGGALSIAEEGINVTHSSDEQFRLGTLSNVSAFNNEVFLAPNTFVPGTNIMLGEANESSKTFPAIAMLPHSVVVAYERAGSTRDVQFTRSRIDNLDFSAPITLGSTSASSNQTHPAISVTLQGLVLALWEDDVRNPLETETKTKIMYAYSNDNGTSFVNGTVLPSDNGLPDNHWSCRMPALTYGGTYTYAAWLSGKSGYDSVVCTRWDPANLRFFSNIVYLPSHGVSAGAPSIACRESAVYVAWADACTGTNAIYLSRSTNKGDTFQPSIKVNDGNATAVSPSVAVDPTGVIYVAWMDAREGEFHIRVAKSVDGGVTFGASVKADAQAGADVSQSEPEVRIDGLGNVYVVWSEYNSTTGEGKIRCARSLDGACSFGAISRLDACGQNVDAAQPSFAIDESGGMHVVWSDDRAGNYSIYYTGSMGTGSYSSYGTYISAPIFVGGNATEMKCISWRDTTPAGTGMSIYIRASRDGILWSDWVNVASNGTVPSEAIISTYLQYRADLSTTDSSVTPRLSEFSIGYRRYIKEGTYISTTTRTSEPIQSASATWNLTLSAGSVTVYLSNNNGLDWQPVSNGMALSFSTVGCQLRYRIAITSGDSTPSLQDITISYVAMSFPSNVTLNFGCTGTNDETYHGTFKTPVVVNFTAELDSIMAYAIDDPAEVAICIGSSSMGKIVLSDLDVAIEHDLQLPKCKILTLGGTPVFDGIEASGVIRFEGTASCGKGNASSLIVEARLDSGTWARASGAELWKYEVDTVPLSNGGHYFYARASDSENSSNVQSIRFVVNNHASTNLEIFGLAPASFIILVACILVAIIVVVGAVSYRAQKARAEAAHRASVQPVPEKRTQSQTCALCEADIPPTSKYVSCQCGRSYHPACASRMGSCPHCGKKV